MTINTVSGLEANSASPTRLTAAHGVSFVIPTFNEERFLPRTLDSIAELLNGRLQYEVVVVDNGSTDGTVQIARGYGASVFVLPGITVGALRNYGVEHSTHPIVVFIDADVALTPLWASNVKAVTDQLLSNPHRITGSPCAVPDDATWLERSWFAPWERADRRHINSGHMLIPRALFAQLGGFDETLSTGEDFDLSQRARLQGAEVVNDPALRVVHYGYPKTLRAFVRREMWHGEGDFRGLSRITHSRMARLVLVFGGAHLTAIVGLVLRWPLVTAFSIGLIALLCVAASVRQYHRERIGVVVTNAAVYYLYFAARFASFVRVLAGRSSFSHRQAR